MQLAVCYLKNVVNISVHHNIINEWYVYTSSWEFSARVIRFAGVLCNHNYRT